MSTDPATPASDPSMEDILASIRRILADGEEEGGAPAAEPPQTDPVSTHHAPPHTPMDDVFVLDRAMLIEEQAPIAEPTIPDTPPAPPDYSHLDAGELPPPPLIAPDIAAAAAASLGALTRAVTARHTQIHRGGSPTLEDMVRDEIRPLIKDWLDEHLAPMVERLVRAEIERVVRQTG